MTIVKFILIGAIAMGSFIAALFFLRFWKATKDRFFLYFALSFLIEGINRLLLGTVAGFNDDAPISYLVRLVAYGLILWAIYEKNRRPGKP
ncbi:MAG: DUF5985 family protein [Burkholderiaceae bacterium]